MSTALVRHRECALHEMGAHHPESPARLAAIDDHLLSTGLLAHLVEVDAPLAERKNLIRVHESEYVDMVAAAAPRHGIVHLDPDTAMCPHSYQAARRAAGAVVHAVDLVMSGQAENAFCSVRPPGHHAERARAMGFCFFNNIAVGAAHAVEAHGLSRVAIVDFDVHHGNGTEDIFAENEHVMMVSTFQHPFYPYSGVDGRSERMVNCPLPAYSGSREFRETVEQAWIPALSHFRPEMILVSAGFDAHRDDDMAMLGLTDADYEWVTRKLKSIAQQHAKGRIVSSLEGGYELHALARCVASHLRVLADL
ncbi:MAG: histone deacetylase family protein [Burkholderiales bacterium]